MGAICSKIFHPKPQLENISSVALIVGISKDAPRDDALRRTSPPLHDSADRAPAMETPRSTHEDARDSLRHYALQHAAPSQCTMTPRTSSERCSTSTHRSERGLTPQPAHDRLQPASDALYDFMRRRSASADPLAKQDVAERTLDHPRHVEPTYIDRRDGRRASDALLEEVQARAAELAGITAEELRNLELRDEHRPCVPLSKEKLEAYGRAMASANFLMLENHRFENHDRAHRSIFVALAKRRNGARDAGELYPAAADLLDAAAGLPPLQRHARARADSDVTSTVSSAPPEPEAAPCWTFEDELETIIG